jgi:hypothetical protein
MFPTVPAKAVPDFRFREPLESLGTVSVSLYTPTADRAGVSPPEPAGFRLREPDVIVSISKSIL